jgi:hypothetical protein
MMQDIAIDDKTGRNARLAMVRSEHVQDVRRHCSMHHRQHRSLDRIGNGHIGDGPFRP